MCKMSIPVTPCLYSTLTGSSVYIIHLLDSKLVPFRLWSDTRSGNTIFVSRFRTTMFYSKPRVSEKSLSKYYVRKFVGEICLYIWENSFFKVLINLFLNALSQGNLFKRIKKSPSNMICLSVTFLVGWIGSLSENGLPTNKVDVTQTFI